MNNSVLSIKKDKQYYKFCFYGFLKNLRFFEPFFIIFFLNRGFSFLEIAILYAIREISINLFEIPSGIIADSLGRRKTLASSFLIYILAFLIFYFTSNFISFAIAMLFYALGDAIRSGINKAMIVSYLKNSGQTNHKVEYLGHTRSWSQIGSAISSLLGGILVFFSKQLDIVFLFSIIPYLLDFLNVLSYPKFLDELDNSKLSMKNKVHIGTKLFWKSLREKKIFIALINFSIYSGFYKSIKDFIQPFLKALVLSLPVLLFLTNKEKLSLLLGFVYFVIFLFNALASRKASNIVNFFGEHKSFLNLSLFVGSILGIISGFLIHQLISIYAILFFIIMLMIENIRKPAGAALITEFSESKVHSGLLSVASQLGSIFTSLFVIIIGFLADYYGVGTGIILVSILLGLISLFVRIR